MFGILCMSSLIGVCSEFSRQTEAVKLENEIKKLVHRNHGFRSSDLLLVVDQIANGEIRCQAQPTYVTKIQDHFGCDTLDLERFSF
jgi:hypothetical protein